MNRRAFTCISIVFGILIALGCGKDPSPLSSENAAEGEITLDVTFAPWKPLLAKTAATDAIDKATVYVYDTRNSKLLEKSLVISDGRASGTVAVKGQDNLRVALALFAGDTVNYIGEDTDVDVPARGAATAHIVVHYMGTTMVAPDSALVGKEYRLTWSKLPFLRWYEVQESTTPDFSAQTSPLYNGSDSTCVVEAKSYMYANKTYYYRIRAVTLYGNGPWYGQGSTGIAGIDGTIIIDLSVPQSPPGKSVTLTAPNGGGSFRGGSTVAITWNSALVENVGLQYSIDNGQTWLRIVESVPAWRKRYEWLTPVSAVETCLVRVYDASDPKIASQSASFFGIKVNTGITMVSIPGGRFQMGSFDDNVTPIAITISPFKMSATEITQKQYQDLMGINPSENIGSVNLPVDRVNWFDAIMFCNKLSKAQGLEPCYIDSTECDFTKNGYRLPTDAEWEYACGTGTTTRYYSGDTVLDLEQAAWFRNDNTFRYPQPVGLKTPNAWGLYDMHGNVAEWCHDWDVIQYTDPKQMFERYTAPRTDPTGPETGKTYTGKNKAIRGGDSFSFARWCQTTHQYWDSPYLPLTIPLKCCGFRIVCRSAQPAGNTSR
ncbi:MAG: formylglycine-generating enzyme family protein [Candidatus Latescibacterota bacterium]